MKPEYRPHYAASGPAKDLFLKLLMHEVPWLQETEARKECFMATTPMEYTYGSGPGVRTYKSIPMEGMVKAICITLNLDTNAFYDLCFLNRYDDQKNQLGWHADDSPEMDPNHPIAVVSFGAAREIWWKEQDFKGEIPKGNRQLLENGSLFIMPAGFQQRYFHKIPKHDRPCGPRISLTYRKRRQT
jgi:alkylated DNA repair dioxygenase AlkB